MPLAWQSETFDNRLKWCIWAEYRFSQFVHSTLLPKIKRIVRDWTICYWTICYCYWLNCLITLAAGYLICTSGLHCPLCGSLVCRLCNIVWMYSVPYLADYTSFHWIALSLHVLAVTFILPVYLHLPISFYQLRSLCFVRVFKSAASFVSEFVEWL